MSGRRHANLTAAVTRVKAALFRRNVFQTLQGPFTCLYLPRG